MRKNRFFWLAATIGFVLDQVTKYWVVQSFPNQGDTLALWPNVFHFTYVINTGAAFGFFRGAGWLRWLSLGVSLGLMGLAWWGGKMKLIEQLGYGLILAGALGNGIDRFLFGYVVDFLDFQLIRFPVFNLVDFSVKLIHFPVFNLADVSINIGIVFLLISSWPSPSSPKPS